MNIQKLSWLAGFWEGEGSVSIFKNTRETGTTKLTMTLTIVNTDPSLILEVLKISDELGVKFHLFENKHTNPNWANSYQLTCRKLSSSKIFLESILPYMVGQKQKIAELALRFINSRIDAITENRNAPNSNNEKEIAEIVSKMNRRGITKDCRILNDYTSNTEK